MKWLKAMFLCMVVFAALTVVANDSFSQKEVRVCASTSLFSIANKEPAAFISFQEIITPLTSFSAFGEKLLYLIASLTFFLALFTLSVALLFYERRVSYVRIKIRLLARTILLLCALSYAELDMIMPCLQGHRGELCQFILYEKQAYHELYISKFYYHVEGK